MKILITGASGLIGQALVKKLKIAHELIVLGRDKGKLKQVFGQQFAVLSWDELQQCHLEHVDAIINLAGENIGTRNWSSAQKEKIIQSRVDAAKKLAGLCVDLGGQAPKLLNASAIGIYGLQKNIEQQNAIVYDESTPLPDPTTDFISEVGKRWEAALDQAEAANVSVIKLRFAVVLADQGGALARMLPIFKLGLGGPVGTGEQPFSWVRIDDVVRAIEFLLESDTAGGPYNIAAPEVVTQKVFARTLTKILKRPCIFRMPAFVVKALFGQMGEELLLNGQNVRSTRLKEAGFEFKYKNLESALETFR